MLLMNEPKYEGLRKVISGGQTGADQGGLIAARSLGIETGGYAPKFYRTNLGFQEAILKGMFGLVEHASPSYAGRTKENVGASDGTVIIATVPGSSGSRLTSEAAAKYNKPCLILQLHPPCTEYSYAQDSQKLYDFILEHKISTLNVAGNRDDAMNGVHYNAANKIVLYAVAHLLNNGLLPWAQETSA